MRRIALSLAVTASGLALLAGCSASAPVAAPTTSAAATTAPATSAPATTSAAPTESATPTETTAAPTGVNAADCAELQAMLVDSYADLSEGIATLQTKPKKGLKILKGFADEFRDAIAQVSNADVAETATEALGALDDMNAALTKLIKDPTSMTAAEFQEISGRVQTEFTDIDTVCNA